MFNQDAFGKKLKNIRKEKNLTQEEVAEKIGVSGQAVSKWEKGECLPDVYNLKLLGKLYRISVDNLLAIENDGDEKVIETIKIGEAVFEIIEKPATIFAGKIIYAKDFADFNAFETELVRIGDNKLWHTEIPYNDIIECKLPVCDVGLSINFWHFHDRQSHGYGWVRETTAENQPEGIDIYKMPASLFIRAYTDKYAAQLLSKKKQCEIYELFAYIRDYFMREHGFKMNENGAQELEIYDTAEHTTGYAYMPVKRA